MVCIQVSSYCRKDHLKAHQKKKGIKWIHFLQKVISYLRDRTLLIQKTLGDGLFNSSEY